MRITLNIQDWIESVKAWFWHIIRKILKLYVHLRFYRYHYWRRIEFDLLEEIIEQMPRKYYDIAENQLTGYRTWKEDEDEEIGHVTEHAIWDVLEDGESWIERYVREFGQCRTRQERYVLNKLKCAGLSLFRVEKRAAHFGAFVKDLLSLKKNFFLWDPSMADNALPGDLMLMRVISLGGIRMVANSTAYIFEGEVAAALRERFNHEVLKPVWSGKIPGQEAIRKQKAFFFRRMMEDEIPYQLFPFAEDGPDEEDEDKTWDSAEEIPHVHPHGEDLCPQCREEREAWDRGFFKSSPPYVRTAPKTGRNDPCPCGSGKKYKKCCGNSN